MEQIQEKLVKPQRMHLIELFDTGNTLRYNENIMIMELVPIKEIHQVAIHISTKFDIWSLGMIIIEIHIDRLRFKQGKDSLNEQNREVFLRELGNLYLGFERNQLWLKFQKTALLVTNLLHNQRALRLTAQGILNYLDDSCNLEELMPIKNAKDLRIFNTLNFGDFKRMVVQKMRVNRLNVWKSDHREMKSEYAQMSASLKAIIGAQQQHIESMDAQRQLFEICEKE
uniref:Protein kinase domain-containing protein n=1 Tax=Globodera pallida TaxID=36090 RepID=A0A183C2H8_GLOPA